MTLYKYKQEKNIIDNTEKKKKKMRHTGVKGGKKRKEKNPQKGLFVQVHVRKRKREKEIKGKHCYMTRGDIRRMSIITS